MLLLPGAEQQQSPGGMQGEDGRQEAGAGGERLQAARAGDAVRHPPRWERLTDPARARAV